MIKKIKGTQDIFFEDVKYWHYVEEAMRKITHLYSFEEIRTPVFEVTELFKRGVGESTDVVQKEMYTFEDKGGRSITLRPEGTASIARAYIENGFLNHGAPVKLYYNGPMFRYERPQAGRYRQFHQFGVETLGSSHPTADFEVIELGIRFIKELKIQEAELYINTIGCEKCRPKYREALKEYFSDKLDNMCDDCKRRYDTNVLRLLDCKVDKEAAAGAPSIHDYLCDDCRTHFESLKGLLKAANVKFEIDSKLVRGLDYYSKTAFEIRSSKLGSQNQILGGGRYDGLLEYIGGRRVPAVGFAVGVERIIMLLKELQIDLNAEKTAEVAILAFGDEGFARAFELADRLRRKSISTFVDVMDRNMRNKFKHAARLGSKIAVILGEEELSRDVVTIKFMEDGTQSQVDADWMDDYIEDKLKEM